MKDRWEYKQLGEVCDSITNIRWQSIPPNQSFSYVDLSAVDRDSLSIVETIKVNKDDAPSRAKQIIHTDDVLFGTTRPTLKRVCLVKDDYDGSVCSTGFCVLRAKEKLLFPKWIFYQLLSSRFYSYIEPLQSGASYPAVSDGIVKSYNISIPPLSEQHSIIEELDLLSHIIEKKKTQLYELDNLGQSIFYEMFGDSIPKDVRWERVPLDKVCRKVSNIKWKSVPANKSYTYVDLTAVNRSSHNIEDVIMINKEDAPSRAKQIIHTNDVLFGNTRPTLKRVCLVKEQFDESICSTGFCVLRPKDNISPHWLFYVLLSNDFYNYIEPLQSGASYPAVSDTIVKSFVSHIPPIKLQQEFACRIKEIEHTKGLIKLSINEIKTLFNSRMDYYFN